MNNPNHFSDSSSGGSSSGSRKENHNAKKPGNSLYSGLLSALMFIVLPILIAVFLTAFVIQSYQVDGESMEVTLQDRDRLIVNKLPRTWSRITRHPYIPNRGDIIIFNQVGLPDSFYEKQLIKRVIALPGERVQIKNGSITVYNNDNPSGFNPDTQGKYVITAASTSGNLDWQLGPNEVFVCGDNRDNSEDSRIFGPVKVNSIVGKLEFRILPLNNTRAF